MDREPSNHVDKLTAVVAADFPKACDIIVSHPEDWELIHKTWRSSTPLYLSALPADNEAADPDRFGGLPPEINRDLVNHRVYRLFYPWLLPCFSEIGGYRAETPQEGERDYRIQLTPIGYGQVWFGTTYGVILECSIVKVARGRNWKAELSEIVESIKKDMNVTKVFAEPTLQGWGEDYTEVLTLLGFTPEPNSSTWWSNPME